MVKYFLYGPSGAGKSTVGRLLAKQLDLPFSDLDIQIQSAAGRTIPQIFESEGEAGFRRIETAALDQALTEPGEAVIALGGGALLDPENRRNVEAAGPVLCLTAEAGVLYARLSASDETRPLLAGGTADRLEAYLAERAAHYSSFAASLDTSSIDPDTAAAQAGRIFGAFRITGMGAAYDARIRRGGLADLPEYLSNRGLAGPYLLAADSNTAVYAKSLAPALGGSEIFTFPAGEAEKTAATAERAWAALSAAGLERGSTLIAVGGGVVGDLAGFAAATYLRGIDWVCLPTSLLAMVDASLGGKTGVDLPEGKNLVGAFHAPRLVLADPNTLRTLPVNEFTNGMAEVIKSAVIGDPDLFSMCNAGDANTRIDEIIARAAAVKVTAIVQDPYEKGVRAHLNYGHTIGHAVEHESGYDVSHGQAVAIGMAAETELSVRLGLAEDGLNEAVRGCLAANALPTAIPPDLDRARILQTMLKDKKKTGGRLRFALPVRIGEMTVVEVDESDYRAVIFR